MSDRTRTTVDFDGETYLKLRAWLEAHSMSLADWIDKQARRELGLPPKFSYKTTARKEEGNATESSG